LGRSFLFAVLDRAPILLLRLVGLVGVSIVGAERLEEDVQSDEGSPFIARELVIPPILLMKLLVAFIKLRIGGDFNVRDGTLLARSDAITAAESCVGRARLPQRNRRKTFVAKLEGWVIPVV
jgi:hypothetical protein